MRFSIRTLSLQAKISLVLVAVIVPTFVIVTLAENKLTLPVLSEEIRQIGIHSGKTLAARIESGRLLSLSSPTPAIESVMQEILFSQPDLVRVDVLARDPATGGVKVVATNMEDEPGTPPPVATLIDTVLSEYKTDDLGNGYWDVYVPIEHQGRDIRGPRRLLGMVHVTASTNLVARLTDAIWKTQAMAALLSVIILFGVLSYFLRKTITNDRLLRLAESQNLQLTEQLHETQRQLMITEKLAVMGQLTASFAHEIGTPLNAIGGHLQLLKEEIVLIPEAPMNERFEVIQGQLAKIALIVKGFLQSTAKPESQKQLVDPNRLVEKTLGIVAPRIEAMGIEVKRQLDREMGPVRVVPLDLEQVLLNVLNNSLDSIQSKVTIRGGKSAAQRLEVSTEILSHHGRILAQLSILDSGEGIKRTDLKNVLKPFFTTKRPGEGTGLGLTICQQLVQKYGGDFVIDSKEGVWTKVVIRLPYHTSA